MVCAGLETLTDTSITGILAFPTTCHYYFYLEIMAAFFIILAMILYNKDILKLGKPDMISSMGVSAIATIFISTVGTAINIIQQDVFLIILVVGLLLIAVWIFKK